MRKVIALRLFFATYLVLVILVGALPYFLGDELFYHSDTTSMTTALAALALMASPLAVLIVGVVALLPVRIQVGTATTISLLAAVAVLAMALIFGLLYLESLTLLAISDFASQFSWFALPAVAVLLSMLVVGLMMLRSVPIPQRIQMLGGVAFAVCILGVASSAVSAWVTSSAEAHTNRQGRQLAFVVLDGLPAHLVTDPFANTLANKPSAVHTDPRVYTAAYSSYPYTYSYFGILYAMDARVVFDSRLRGTDKTLVQSLQRNNVEMRLVNFHRNGIPESSGAKARGPNGLKSYFLTENYAWFPRLLGLRYHLMLASSYVAQNLRPGFAEWLFTVLNPPQPDGNVLVNTLLDEMRELRSRSGDSMILFHANWYRTKNSQSKKIFERGRFPGGFKLPEWRYRPDGEEAAARMRRIMADEGEVVVENIRDFVAHMRADPLLQKSTVVFTADHGTMYSEGRYFYAYHPYRKVTQVPLLVFDGGHAGLVGDSLVTPDLSKEIIRLFQRADGANVFEPQGRPDGPALTVTHRADRNKEFYLVISYADHAYWVNLHRDGDGAIWKVVDEDNRQEVAEIYLSPPPELAKELPSMIDSLGISRKRIHPNFSSLSASNLP